MLGRSAVLSVLLLLVTAVGCEREPLPFVCPELSVGALVGSEIRGPQSGEVEVARLPNGRVPGTEKAAE